MIKIQEVEFAYAVLNKLESESVRDIINQLQPEIPRKRMWWYLTKWNSKGYYNYGVNLELGWLEEKGIRTFRSWIECFNNATDSQLRSLGFDINPLPRQ